LKLNNYFFGNIEKNEPNDISNAYFAIPIGIANLLPNKVNKIPQA